MIISIVHIGSKAQNDKLADVYIMKLGFDQSLMSGISELPEVIQQILIFIILFYHIMCVFLKYTI